ncbi:MAG: hypothetical protein C0594_05920 [Marinilabiliales bacterium]|nr:MAG: hypothetical protein C0594_05920 [Marinilabiliales bacterium]
MNKKAALILEIVWLVVAIASLTAGIHKTTKHGFSESYLFFIMALVAILVYSFRRHLRIRRKLEDDKKDSNSEK